ncbi:hypothetical protein [Burkholderia cenocepacia]|uniref:hypothetical protein n=1 Tax=Burkholderia cenocepacia TaxID=95486 RepID=UPI00136575CE|nr:hypothetical protein [Burkholderia cenocepacia]
MTVAKMTLEMARKSAGTLLKQDVSEMSIDELKQAVQAGADESSGLPQKLLVALKADLDREFPVLH